QAEDGIRDKLVTGVQTCALPIFQLFLELLAGYGVRHIFGNPGTTEMPLNDALVGDRRFQYVLGLQEVPVMAMADGFAMASGGLRSEERRVGKECRSGSVADCVKA